jgi:hypothetical protein
LRAGSEPAGGVRRARFPQPSTGPRRSGVCREAARTDPHFADHFGHAERLERLFDATETQYRSRTVVSRAIGRSYDDLVTIVAFFLDAVVDELVERVASAIPPEPNGDWILTTHHRVTWHV